MADNPPKPWRLRTNLPCRCSGFREGKSASAPRGAGGYFDGANWIRTLKEGYFPEAIGFLDIWHLEKELAISSVDKFFQII